MIKHTPNVLLAMMMPRSKPEAESVGM